MARRRSPEPGARLAAPPRDRKHSYHNSRGGRCWAGLLGLLLLLLLLLIQRASAAVHTIAVAALAGRQ